MEDRSGVEVSRSGQHRPHRRVIRFAVPVSSREEESFPTVLSYSNSSSVRLLALFIIPQPQNSSRSCREVHSCCLMADGTAVVRAGRGIPGLHRNRSNPGLVRQPFLSIPSQFYISTNNNTGMSKKFPEPLLVLSRDWNMFVQAQRMEVTI